MYFITTKRMLEVCFSAHPNIQYRTISFINYFFLHLCRTNVPACFESGEADFNYHFDFLFEKRRIRLRY
ncbi:Uncharacterised protein [[Clostridium] symbiosum]|nr:Uncharacterised protein [[Clostridium] symbiosum]